MPSRRARAVLRAIRCVHHEWKMAAPKASDECRSSYHQCSEIKAPEQQGGCPRLAAMVIMLKLLYQSFRSPSSSGLRILWRTLQRKILDVSTKTLKPFHAIGTHAVQTN